jgi:hypothetical protein
VPELLAAAQREPGALRLQMPGFERTRVERMRLQTVKLEGLKVALPNRK